MPNLDTKSYEDVVELGVKYCEEKRILKLDERVARIALEGLPPYVTRQFATSGLIYVVNEILKERNQPIETTGEVE